MTKKLGFIGGGNMASAIIGGILGSGLYLPEDLFVYDIDSEKAAGFAARGLTVPPSPASLATAAGIIMLSVKPQNYQEVLEQIAGAVTPDKLIISIAAGISTGYIRDFLGGDIKVARVMPNTPLLLGKGASAFCVTDNLTEEEKNTVAEIFAASGIITELPESLMNTVTAVNGSSPAYIYLFAKAIVDYAAQRGIDKSISRELIAQTLIGSGRMIQTQDLDLETLIRMVASPKGTTEKALETFEAGGFEPLIHSAMASCIQRADELGR